MCAIITPGPTPYFPDHLQDCLFDIFQSVVLHKKGRETKETTTSRTTPTTAWYHHHLQRRDDNHDLRVYILESKASSPVVACQAWQREGRSDPSRSRRRIWILFFIFCYLGAHFCAFFLFRLRNSTVKGNKLRDYPTVKGAHLEENQREGKLG